MLTRRAFLTRSTTVLLLVPIAASCTSSSYSNPNPGPNTSGGCDGIDATSTVVDAHDHMVCVLTSDLTNPPAAGVTYTSTNASGHTHSVTLTHDQLAAVEAGTEVTVTSSVAVDTYNGQSHTHEFMVVKA